MTNYGTETDIAYPDINTKVETIKSIRDSEIKSSFKRYTVRLKVMDKTEETEAYLKFSRLIEDKKHTGRLLYRHNDLTMLPTFVIEYPKVDVDGSYFVVTSYTEVLL